MTDIDSFRNDELRKKLIASEFARYKDPKNVDIIVELDNSWREKQYEVQKLKTELNKYKKRCGIVMKTLKTLKTTNPAFDLDDVKVLERERDYLTNEMALIKSKIKKSEILAEDLLERRNNMMNIIGNMVHGSVVISDNEKDNVIVHEWNTELFYKKSAPLHHSDVMKKLGMYNSDAGVKVSGHRGYFLCGNGVKLNQALIRYGMDFLENEGYSLLQTPFFMTAECMSKTAQLSDYHDLLYKVGDDKYLIATSEQPISCIHQDEWIHPKRLPIMYAGVSSCFRKEAGASGKDLRGLFRLHQFEKVEQFVLCSPEDSWAFHEKMVEISKRFIESLGLPYRVVNIVSGELNDAAAKKYDIECWFPHTREFRELVSCSNCTDYQARKLLIRYGGKEKGKKVQFVHMLNSTLCATERMMCCIAEYYQTDDGMVVPEVLRKYINNQPEKFEYK